MLFVSSGEACRALLAVHYAHLLGAEWVEARAVGLDASARCALPEIDPADQTKYALDPENIAWADLVVSLDEAAALACAALPAQVVRRCYPVPPPTNADDWPHVCAAIQARVAGMIGGMRMMNR